MCSLCYQHISEQMPKTQNSRYDLIIPSPKNHQYPPDRISQKSNTQINKKKRQKLKNSRVKINHQYSPQKRRITLVSSQKKKKSAPEEPKISVTQHIEYTNQIPKNKYPPSAITTNHHQSDHQYCTCASFKWTYLLAQARPLATSANRMDECTQSAVMADNSFRKGQLSALNYSIRQTVITSPMIPLHRNQ